MDVDVFKIVGARAKSIRESRSMELDQLASRIGVTARELDRFERAVERIGLDKLARLVNVLGVPMASLFVLEERNG
ncbi:MAG: helix-turn-helix transcriptional regulator [Pseudomonadota bacterium]